MGLPSAAEAKQLLKSFTSERPRPREGKTKQTEWPAAASGRKRNTCKRERILHLQNKNRMLGLKSIEGCKGVRKVDGKSKRLGTVVCACYRKKGQCKELSIKKKKLLDLVHRPGIPGTWEVQAGGSQIQELPGLQSGFKTKVGNLVRPCLEQAKIKSS